MIRVLSRKRRTLRIAVAGVLGLAMLAVGLVFFALRTGWFDSLMRQKVITAIEQASGGKVELGEFAYDWHTLTVEFRNVILHGTETDSESPLFKAYSVRLGLRIVSVFKRNFDIASLIVDRPQVHVIIGPDGATNMPSPRRARPNANQMMQDLLNLKVRHFELNRGTFQVNAQSVPIDARGDQMHLSLAYERLGPRYHLDLSLRNLQVNARQRQWPNVQLQIKALLEKDRVMIQNAKVVSGGSNLYASGVLRNFARPVIELPVSGRLAAAEIATAFHIPDLRGGELTLSGTAHRDEYRPFTFSGKIAGHGIAYRSGPFAFKNAVFQSDMFADSQALKLTALSLEALGGRFSGRAIFPSYRDLQLEGNVSRVDVHRLSVFVSKRTLPWSGIASGPVRVQSPLSGFRNLSAWCNLQIAPGSNGPESDATPVSGNLDLTYKRSGNLVEFGSSRIRLPGTELSFSGALGTTLHLVFDSTNLEELKPALLFVNPNLKTFVVPVLLHNGSAHFDGQIAGILQSPQIDGNVSLSHFRMQELVWDQVRSRIIASSDELSFSSLVVDSASLHASGDGRLQLRDWTLQENDPLRLHGQFRGADIPQLARIYFSGKLPFVRGVSSGSFAIDGSLAHPRGTARMAIDDLVLYGETIDKVQLETAFDGNEARITSGRMQAGPAMLSFTGGYRRGPNSWREGDLDLKIDSNGFPIASITSVREYESGLNASLEIHGAAAAHIVDGHIEPKNADGTAMFRNVTFRGVRYGSVTFNSATQGEAMNAGFIGDLRGSRLSGNARVQLTGDNPVKGELRLDRIDLSILNAIVNPGSTGTFPVGGFLAGGLTFEGPLRYPDKLGGTVQIQELQVASNGTQAANKMRVSDLVFRNTKPILLEASGGLATIRSFELSGKETSLSVSGSIPYVRQRPLDLKMDGSMDLRFFQFLDPNVQSSGQAVVAGSIRGTLSNPAIDGTLELKNGSFFFKNVPNGLTAVNGTVKFDRDRATIQKLTGQTGGGELSLGGFVSFASGSPLVYRLEANTTDVRIRYANSISVTASSQLRLSGTSENSILSGTATVSRVVFNPNTDVGNLLASFGVPVPSPSNEKDFLTGMQFDVRVESAPNLQLSTELSHDVQAEIDLRLRGSPNHPILLGSVAANQGDIKIFGSQYSINRGEVNFSNTVRIEPVLDLDLQTIVRGITVDVTVAGALGRLNINYRSDPPLQPRDIIALLTVGRAPSASPNVPAAQAVNDVTAQQSSANTLLGQAISPAPNRLSRLFGVTNIRIDPMVQSVVNTPQARLTVEENISRQITVTYVTNLSQTSEQIFRVECALSPQYSLVALRDDNGEFGIDIQYKKRFK